MLKKTIFTTAFIFSLANFQPAQAKELEHVDLSKTESREKYQSMSDEERKAFHEQRKAKWDSMSDEEKLKMIETRRAEKKAKMEQKWNSMSDADKIAFVEKKMEKRAGHTHGGEN